MQKNHSVASSCLLFYIFRKDAGQTHIKFTVKHVGQVFDMNQYDNIKNMARRAQRVSKYSPSAEPILMFGRDIPRNVAAEFNKKHPDTRAITRLTPPYAFNVPGLQIQRARTYITRR